MLAVATTHNLVTLDQATLKRPPASVPPTCSLPLPPTSVIWSPDGASLFLSNASEIHTYDSSGIFQSTSYSSAEGPLSNLASKDRGSTVIFSRGQHVHVLQALTGTLAQTFDSHKAPITSLALSNDGTLLATTSANAIHVHNLSHGAHTVLRGLPAASHTITSCTFHAHSRTRLLVGAGAQLLVYDTTRPSAPLKAIPLSKDKSGFGDIVSVASSPFSKTLVAVASSGGIVSLVDLEKEKSLCRSISYHVPLTALVFSPEGATLYAGTENGKVLVQALRSLDKPPKSVTVSEDGDRVVSMSIQKKSQPEDVPPKAVPKVPSKPLAQQDVNKVPTRRVSGSTGADKPIATAPTKTKTTSPLATRTLAGKGTPSKTRVASSGSPRARPVAAKSPTLRKASSGGIAKRVFSPPKSPLTRRTATADAPPELDVSVRIENLLALPTSSKAKENARLVSDESRPPSRSSPSGVSAAISRASSRTSSRGDGGKAKSRMMSSSRASASASAAPSTSRTRSASGNSATSSASSDTAGKTTRPSTSAPSRPPPAPVPSISSVPDAPRADLQESQSRTPSPDLPNIDDDAPVTPVPASKRKGKERMNGMGILSLGTPDVERWIRAGEVREPEERRMDGQGGKRVGFASEERGAEGAEDEDGDRGAVTEEKHKDVEPGMAVQISPLRHLGGSPASWAPVGTPLRNLAHGTASSGSPRTHAAAGLLQSVLRDAMYELRRETHGEMVGLHLDMLRMGRGLRTELRSVVDEFRGELSALQEENRRLREENERLRRGY